MKHLDMTMTVWQRGEEIDRHAVYEPHTAACHWEEIAGSRREANGNVTLSSLLVLTDDDTISNGDKLSLGVDNTMPEDARTVTHVDTFYLRGNFHHVEVYAE